MRYLSVCSGIEAASAAWHPLGFEPVAFSEIEKFPCAVLKHHYPETPNWGDMTKFQEWPDVSVDLLVGGTPCQSFSTAGLRKGLADPRGNLALVYLGIADQYRPRWIVWENVPGVLSSNGGRDFGAFIGALGQLGYGFAYRVLDAQYCGVPQRRRRVFVVGHLGDWRPAAAVLFERESMRRDTPPSREAGEGVTGGFEINIDDGCNARIDQSGPLMRSKQGVVCYENHAQDSRIKDCGDLSPQLNAKAGTGGSNLPLIMAHGQAGAEVVKGGSPSLSCNHEAPILYDASIRRLTPRECERLQGLPDDYTRIPWRGKAAEDCPDGPRYKAIGNSMAVPVMRWIGERIAAVESET